MNMLPYRNRLYWLLPLLLLPAVAFAEADEASVQVGHSDPIAPVILGVTGILFFALIGRFTARKLGLPSVLGELTMGIVLGNLAYFFQYDLIMVLREGPAMFDTMAHLLRGETPGSILPQGCRM